MAIQHTGAVCLTHHKIIAIVAPKYGLVGDRERFASEITGRLAE